MPSEEVSVRISLIDHVGINITDLTRSAEWYERVLGFKVIHKWKTTWMIKRGKMRIGLFQRPEATPVEDLNNKIAITHLAFLTDAEGFEKAQKDLKKLGVPFEPPDDSGIAYSIFFKDPDGHEMEVTTYHPPAPKQAEKESNQIASPCRTGT
jgi:catechol 2,3-dioxygenase-like lactoylglutathione lyase family enzyme